MGSIIRLCKLKNEYKQVFFFLLQNESNFIFYGYFLVFEDRRNKEIKVIINM